MLHRHEDDSIRQSRKSAEVPSTCFTSSNICLDVFPRFPWKMNSTMEPFINIDVSVDAEVRLSPHRLLPFLGGFTSWKAHPKPLDVFW